MTARERLLGQARSDLVALPDLVAELARLVADRHHDITGYRGKVIGSPAPLQIPIVHLVGGGAHRPAWWGEDPRQPRWALTWYDRYDRETRKGDEKTAHTSLHPTEGAAWRAFHRETGLPAPLEQHQMAPVRVTPWRASDQYSVADLLESWVRVLAEQLPEWPDLTERATVRSEAATLIEHWPLIEQTDWALQLADDIDRITATVRAQLGQKPEPTYRCAQCNNPAYMQPGGILACTEVPDHDLVVRDLEQQMRRRPPLPTKDICEEFDLEVSTLRVWKHRRKIKPAPNNGSRRDMWFPWDVFCLMNPDFAEAIAVRDALDTTS